MQTATRAPNGGVTGTSMLKGTQHYPKAFGEAVAAASLSRQKAGPCASVADSEDCLFVCVFVSLFVCLFTYFFVFWFFVGSLISSFVWLLVGLLAFLSCLLP